MTEAFDVFLSHNGQDKPAVERIAERLRRAGLRPWLDTWELTPGGRWQDELHDGLEACRAFAYFMGPHGEGDWAREELDAARSRAANERDFRIFPVLLPGVPDPFDRTTMPPFLGHRTWVDFRGGIDDRRAFQALINAVKGVPLGAPEEASLGGSTDVSPYRGLEPFDEADADVFFGRDADIQLLLEKLKGSRFLAVLGPSGSGKSSLVRAGLVPALRRGALPRSESWSIEVLKPGARPLEAIAARLQRLGRRPGEPADSAEPAGMAATLDALASDDRTLHLATTLALGEDPVLRCAWVIDQAEEMFTLCREEAQRAAFIGNLVYAASVPGGRAMVVLAMRADFYARSAGYPDLAASISHTQHLVGPLTPEGVRDVIEEPARRVGLEFEEGLVGTILEDLEDQPGSLPLLEYALLELWKRRRGAMLTLEAYRESGGVQGAIAKRAESIYAAFTPDEQAIARRALLRLTQPGEGTEDTRRRASMSELVTRVDEAPEVEAVIGELTDARLLTATADPATGEGLVDISHEALIRAWPRVRQWLDEDRAGQRVLRRITESAAEWQRLGRDEGLLFRGARLAEATEWRDDNDEMLNDQERAFLDASVALRDREREARERTRRLVTIGAGVLAAVFLVLAGLAGVQWLSAESERRAAEEQRQVAEAARTEADRRAMEAELERQRADEQRRLAEQQREAAEQAQAEAEAQRQAADEQRRAADDARRAAEEAQAEALARAVGFQASESEAYPDRALLLALEARRRSGEADIESLFLRELTGEPRLVRFVGEPGAATTWLDIDETGARVAWIDVNGRVRVAALAEPDTLLLDELVEAGQGNAVALSPDGSQVVAAAGSTVRSWDVASGELLWETLVPEPAWVGRLAFVSGDPLRVAVAGNDGSVRMLGADDGVAGGPTIAGEVAPAGGTLLSTFAFAFSPDGTAMIRGEQDGSVSIWDVAEGTQEGTSWEGLEGLVPTDFHFSGPEQVFVLYPDRFGLLVRGETPTFSGGLSVGVADGLRVGLAGPGGGILVASANRGLRYLSSATLASSDLAWEPMGKRPQPYALDISADLDTVVAGYPDGRLAIYDMGRRWPLATPLAGMPVLPGTPSAFDQGLAIRRDGGAFAWWDQASSLIHVVDDAGATLADIPAPAYVEALALADDGTGLFIVEDRPEDDAWVGHLVELSLPDGARLSERRLGPWGYRLSLSADGTRLAIGDSLGGLRVVETASGTDAWVAPADPERRKITALELSADGRTLRAGADLGSGPFGEAALLTFEIPSAVEPAADASPGPVEGSPAPAEGSPDARAAPTGSITIGGDRISAIATTPDGALTVVAAADGQATADGTLLLLRAGSAETSGSLGPPGDNVTALRFAPDGRLLSGGPLSGWLSWTVDPGAWVEQACAIAARDLTPGEWAESLGGEPYLATCSAEGAPPEGGTPPAGGEAPPASPEAAPAGPQATIAP